MTFIDIHVYLCKLLEDTLIIYLKETLNLLLLYEVIRTIAAIFSWINSAPFFFAGTYTIIYLLTFLDKT